MPLFLITRIHDRFETRMNTLEKMRERERETGSERGDRHTNEETSLLYAPYLFSLTCTIACSLYFRTNRSNRAQYEHRNLYENSRVITTISLQSLIIIKQIILLSLNLPLKRRILAPQSFACAWYVYIYLYPYGIIAVIVINSNLFVSFL